MEATKQIGIVGKVGPAFSVNEVQMAHRMLDEFKVPRMCGNRAMGLPARISWLNGQLTAARLVAGYVNKAKKAQKAVDA